MPEYEIHNPNTSYVVCKTCGCLVLNTHAHDRFHADIAAAYINAVAELLEHEREQDE